MNAVVLEGVWKSYPRWPGGERTLRAVVARRAPLGLRRGERHWALEDVSMTVARGESVGVIGPNGAGKSTLLRLAAGLGRPTRGRIAIDGRTAAVLSLGNTLDMSLTGRENAMTAAVVAGLRRSQARALVPAALEFAQLEDVADAPIRTYSEGMKLRLAFGVVAQLEPEVLLLDEVIAVGDLAFQARCMTRVQELREAGTTVVFASHDLNQVAAECDRAMWLRDGVVAASGEAGEVVDRYREEARRRAVQRTPPPAPGDAGELRLRENRVGTQEATIERVAVAVGDDGAVAVTLELLAHRPGIVDPIVSVSVHREADGLACCELTTRDDGVRLGPLDGTARVELALERLDLAPGDYRLDVGLYRNDWDEVFDFHWRAYPLRVEGEGSGKGLVEPPRRWAFGPG